MHTLGHFDIYGCLLAICLLLIPARSIAYVWLAAACSVVLVLIHHIHVLMYVPAITTIVVLRYYLVQRVNQRDFIAGVAAAGQLGQLGQGQQQTQAGIAAQLAQLGLGQQNAYLGAAPVPLDDYVVSVEAQTIRAEAPQKRHLIKAFADISIEPEMLDRPH